MVTRGKPQSGAGDLGVALTAADSWSGHGESYPLISPSVLLCKTGTVVTARLVLWPKG